MAKSPFKLKSGNGTPFKQMGSAPMTRNQARSLSQRHMKGGAYTTMPGESRFQMHKRLRRAGTIGDTTETYLGKHQAAEETSRLEGVARGKVSREKFVSDVGKLGKGLMSIPGKIIGKAKEVAENIDIPSHTPPPSEGATDWSTYESVNDLVRERTRMREADEDETEIQVEINKRLEENPGVWD